MNSPLNNAADPRVVRVGVFFDGTGKNGNTLKFSPTETFNVTNIFRLHKHYGMCNPDDEPSSYLKVYVEGIGTMDNKADDLYSIVTGDEALFGVKGYGPDSKMELCLQRIENELMQFLSAPGHESEPVCIEFDVFGFSRGAVLARHFTNLIADNDDSLANMLRGVEKKSGREFDDVPLVNFLGLFDTVGSFFDNTVFEHEPHDTGYTRNLKVKVGKDAARHAFQLNAMHECRFNFALHSLHGHFPEITIAGAHIDVGGGYAEVMHETKDISTYRIYLPFSYAKTRVNQKLQMLKTGKMAKLLKEPFIYVGSERWRCFARNVRTVKGHLQFVAFIAMLKVAVQHGCKFDQSYRLYEKLIPDNLMPYLSQVVALAKRSSLGDSGEIDMSLIDDIAAEYVHLSASWNSCLDLYGDIIRDSKSCMSVGQTDKLQQKTINLDVLNNYQPDRPDFNWVRKVFL